MIYATAKVGGPLITPLVLSIVVVDSTPLPVPHEILADNDGVYGFVSDIHDTATEVRGHDSLSDSYVLSATIPDAQVNVYPTLTDNDYAYDAPTLRLFAWDEASFNDPISVLELPPVQLVRTGHIKLTGNGTFLDVTDNVVVSVVGPISDPEQLPAQPTQRTGMLEWINRDLRVNDARSLTKKHLTVSDAEIVTEDLNKTYTTTDLLNVGEKPQYWS